VGRLTRLALAALLALGLSAAWPVGSAAGFTGFGAMSAEATYGASMTFRVKLEGGAPDRLELLLRFAGDDGLFVAPVTAGGEAAKYVWDTGDRHVTPNTRVTYAWRATVGGEDLVSDEGTLLYDDDRSGLDWQSTRLGEATVHWYGGAEPVAVGLGELAADGAADAEALLGHEMSGAVDIFIYDSGEDFSGALGPGAREWIGAATYPALRTIFMNLTAGDRAYLERTLVHEVTHVVFNDATDNPYHEPAKWLNEGLASWAESQSAADERSEVEFQAANDGLFAFEAIAEQFPIGERGARLAYAQGATMVDMIVAEHGDQAIAEIAEAYRQGASDSEALQAGTERTADELFADFYAEFGVEPPQAVEPAPIPPSDVRKPGGGVGSGGDGGPRASAEEPDGEPAERQREVPWAALVAVIGGVAAVLGLAWWTSRRRAAEDPG
jgi:hypothetical protein